MQRINGSMNANAHSSSSDHKCSVLKDASSSDGPLPRMSVLFQRTHVAAILLTLALAAPCQAGLAQTAYRAIHSFAGPPSDGAYPEASLIQAKDGYFYGTTMNGGPVNTVQGSGTFFRMNAAGNVTVLHSFGYPDGEFPMAPVIQAKDGYFYGTTAGGGDSPNGSDSGTVFKVDSSGHETVLYSFGTNADDGSQPQASLIQASDGYLYGTTTYGGSITVNGKVVYLGNGTVFKMNTSGHLIWTYAFGTNVNDGALPMGALIQPGIDYLYGTTYSGGVNGAGTIFRIDTSGHESVVYSFGAPLPDGTNDGINPMAALLRASDGWLYGTASEGGNYGGGTVFKFDTTNESYVVLHSFGVITTDGQYPEAPLIQASDGYLYGTTSSGGQYDTTGNVAAGNGDASGGTVFRLDPTGVKPSGTNQMAYAYWVLHSFGETATDGQVPVAALIQASDGNLYGTTENGGVYSDPNASEEFQGTIYSLTTTLAMQAHVSAHSTVGKMVSYTVTITLYNTGYFEAANVTVDRATLGSKASSTAMPLPVGNIGAGAYKSVTCTFLAKAGILQTLVGFDVTVTFTGGTFIGNCIVTL